MRKHTLLWGILGASLALPLHAQVWVSPSSNAQAEPMIAVNPTNPNNLVATAITGNAAPLRIGVWRTTDGGITWMGTDVIGAPDEYGWGDPVVAFDPDGTAYLLYQEFAPKVFYMHHSSDGGSSWSGRTQVHGDDFQLDRPWMAVNPVRRIVGGSSLFDIYISYAQTALDQRQHIVLLKSTDGGLAFSQVENFSPATGRTYQGSSVAADGAGTLIVAWADMPKDGHVSLIHLASSTDGGNSFTGETAYNTTGIPQYLFEGIKADSYPRLGCTGDQSNAVPIACVVWAAQGSTTGADVLYARGSRNAQGVYQWQGPYSVDASVGDQWCPAVSVSPDGVISVLYYSSPDGSTIHASLRYSTDGGQTFADPPAGRQISVDFPTSGGGFLGDYIGLASSMGLARGIWVEDRDHGAYASRQMYTRAVILPERVLPSGFVKTKLTQLDASEVPFGIVGLWNQVGWTGYAAEARVIFATGGTQALRAQQDFKSGTVQKYQKWHLDSDVKNHRTFSILSTSDQFAGRFGQTVLPVSIKTSIADLPGSTGGNIQFRDPWYIDLQDVGYASSWRNRGMDSAVYRSRSVGSAGFQPDNTTIYLDGPYPYCGVFLNQDYNIPGQPYYSVGAPLTQTIGGVESYFMEWSASPSSAVLRSPDKDTSAVVFIEAGATVTALYKGHLSSSGNALTNNNQRKVAETTSGSHPYAYGSLNAVWFTMVSGSTVTPEFEVSAGSPGQVNSSPCIVAYGNVVNVVWQSMEWYGQGNGFNLCSILLRRYNASTGVWSPIEYLAAFSPPSENYDATPVIDAYALFSGGHGDAKIVAWREPDGIKVIAHSEEDWGTIGTVSGTNGYSLRPAIYDYNYVDYAFVWEDSYSSAIRYIELGYSDGSWHFLHPKQVSPADWESNSRPSLGFTYVGGAPTGYRPTVVWQSHNNISEGGTSVHVRQLLNFSGDNWSDQITSFTENEYFAANPTVGTLSGGSQFSVAWTNGTAVRKASWNGSSWSDPATLLTDGTEPSATVRGETTVRIAAKKASGLIIDTTFSPSLGKVSSEASLTDGRLKYRLNRHALVDLGAATGSEELFGGTLAFELAGMDLTGDAGVQKLGFTPSTMASQPFTVQKGMSLLTIAGAIYGARLSVPQEVASFSVEPLARLVVRDLRSESVARDLWTVPFSALTSVADSSFGVFRQSRADLSGLAGREVCVEVEMLGKTRGANPIIVTDYLILKNQQGDLAKDRAQKENSSLPTAYALHQNYPNPFNPVSTIAFDLPEATHVRLILYNILGEEIQKVVDEDLPEGFHTRRIVADGLPSGTYIYRITAGPYSESRKMAVVK